MKDLAIKKYTDLIALMDKVLIEDAESLIHLEIRRRGLKILKQLEKPEPCWKIITAMEKSFDKRIFR